MLTEYHRPLLNHQAYAETNGYSSSWRWSSPRSSPGAGQFAQPRRAAASRRRARRATAGPDDGMRRSASRACHLDLDAWFASWRRSRLRSLWAREKDALFEDAGQIWLNTGLLCARPTAWAVAFAERVSTRCSPARRRVTPKPSRRSGDPAR